MHFTTTIATIVVALAAAAPAFAYAMERPNNVFVRRGEIDINQFKSGARIFARGPKSVKQDVTIPQSSLNGGKAPTVPFNKGNRGSQPYDHGKGARVTDAYRPINTDPNRTPTKGTPRSSFQGTEHVRGDTPTPENPTPPK